MTCLNETSASILDIYALEPVQKLTGILKQDTCSVMLHREKHAIHKVSKWLTKVNKPEIEQIWQTVVTILLSLKNKERRNKF